MLIYLLCVLICLFGTFHVMKTHSTWTLVSGFSPVARVWLAFISLMTFDVDFWRNVYLNLYYYLFYYWAVRLFCILGTNPLLGIWFSSIFVRANSTMEPTCAVPRIWVLTPSSPASWQNVCDSPRKLKMAHLNTNTQSDTEAAPNWIPGREHIHCR